MTNYMAKKYCAILLALISIFIFSCKKNNVEEEAPLFSDFEVTETKEISTHNWYYFTKDNFLKSKEVLNISEVFECPWSEATRISSALQLEKSGFMAVNKLGILHFLEDGNIKLYKDDSIFKNVTIGGLLNINDNPFFYIYKNDFFNNEENHNNTFLYHFRAGTGIFYPTLSKSQLQIDKDTEIISLHKEENNFFATLKTVKQDKVIFDYSKILINDINSLLTAAPKYLNLEKNSVDETVIRNFSTPIPFQEAPKRLKSLLERVPGNLHFTVETAINKYDSKVIYINQNQQDLQSNIPISCKAVLNDTYSIGVFADGTTFFAGSLPDKYILNSGKTLAFRLPKLPKGFSYGEIVVAGNNLICSWEEKDFYKILRSGFLVVDLEEVLY